MTRGSSSSSSSSHRLRRRNEQNGLSGCWQKMTMLRCGRKNQEASILIQHHPQHHTPRSRRKGRGRGLVLLLTLVVCFSFFVLMTMMLVLNWNATSITNTMTITDGDNDHFHRAIDYRNTNPINDHTVHNNMRLESQAQLDGGILDAKATDVASITDQEPPLQDSTEGGAPPDSATEDGNGDNDDDNDDDNTDPGDGDDDDNDNDDNDNNNDNDDNDKDNGADDDNGDDGVDDSSNTAKNATSTESDNNNATLAPTDAVTSAVSDLTTDIPTEQNTVFNPQHDIKLHPRTTNNTTKRFVAIHLGPIKTATTTIQQDSGENINFTKALRSDGVLYVGEDSGAVGRNFDDGLKCSIRIMKKKTKTITVIVSAKKHTNVTTTNASTNSNMRAATIHSKKNATTNPIDTIMTNDGNNSTVNTTNSTTITKDVVLTFEEKKKMIRNRCWKEKPNMVYNTTGLVFSNEFYSTMLSGRDDWLSVLYPQFYNLFINYLDYDELIIIGGYRRYYDWILSAYKQRTKQTCLYKSDKQCLALWDYVNKYVIKNNTYATKFCNNLDITMLPFIQPSEYISFENDNDNNYYDSINNQSQVSYNVPTTMAIPANIETARVTNTTTIFNKNRNEEEGSIVKFDILNFFQLSHSKTITGVTNNNSVDDSDNTNTNYNYDYDYTPYDDITTEMYCKSLGMDRTPHTCLYARDERMKTQASHKNKGSADTVKYHDIVWKAKKLGYIKNVTFFIDTTVEETSHNQRIQEVVDLQHYHTETLQLDGTRHLPLVCPTKTQLQPLLEKTIKLEQLIVPGFFRHPLLGKEALITSFWKLVNDKKSFCELDLDRLFQNTTSWDDLLQNRLTIKEW